MEEKTTFLVPLGDGTEGKVCLQMGDVYQAERRHEEIAVINSHKAPELITCFIRAYAILGDYVHQVTTQLVKAENSLAKRKAIVLLDIVPQVLKDKGLKGSEDLRTAVLDTDPAYEQARDLVQQLEAWQELLRGKQKNIENCYLAVRKIIGDSYNNRNQNTGFNPGYRAAEETVETPVRPSLEPGSIVVNVETTSVPAGHTRHVDGSVRAAFGKVRD